MQPHRGTLILVLGILGLVICAPLGIAAWIMGNNDLRSIDAQLMEPSGRDLTQAGRICGIIATCLLAISLLIAAVLLLIAGIGAVLN